MEIVDVVTRINYESNNAGLTESIALLEKQQQAAVNSQNRINALEAALAETAKEDIERRNRIINLIGKQEDAMKRLGQQTAMVIGSNGKLQQAFINTSKQTDTARQAIFSFSQVLREAPAFAFGLVTGINAIANNLPNLQADFAKLKTELGSTSAAMGALARSIVSPINLVAIAIPIILKLAEAFFESGEETKKAAKTNDEYAKTIKSVADNIGTEIFQINNLVSVANNQNLTYRERGMAIDELEKKFPDYFANLDREKILNNEVSISIDGVTESLVRRAEEMINLQRLEQAYQRLAEANIRLNREGFTDPAAYQSLRDEAALARNEIDRLTKSINTNRETFSESEAFPIDDATRKSLQERDRKDKEKYSKSESERNKKTRRKEAKKQEDEIRAAYRRFGEISEKEFAEGQKEAESTDKKRGADYYTSPEYRKFRQDFLLQIAKQQDKINAEQEKKDKEIGAKRLKDIKSYEQAFTTMASTILGTLNMINERERTLIDERYAAQERRVQDALVLAERGNVELYNSEKQRLDAIQKEREQNTQKQIQLNALLQASNAAVAVTEALLVVTNAGKTGDPYTTAARIAAAVAAVAAGFSLVTNLVTASKGFAEGGYTGDGGKFTPAGIVHRGEFVMTKANTAKFRPLLEDIHTGRIKDMGQINSHYAMDTSKLEDGIGDVAEAVKNTYTKVNFHMNERGISLITERHRHLQKRLHS